VLAGNARANVFHTGFSAGGGYASGKQAMAAVRCPTLFVIGRHDQMTPPRAARALARLARQGRTVEVDAGHALMSEAPDAVLFAPRDFLAG
jgi:pimeloyl-ACP methyl ester carboxylesterase